jgi:hypothetical protein
VLSEQWDGVGEAHTRERGRQQGCRLGDLRDLEASEQGGGCACSPSSESLGVTLTGELGPLGPWVVDASKSETPQPFIQQFPVPDAEAQRDTIDLVLSWWLQERRQDMERGSDCCSPHSAAISPHHAS